MYLLHLLQQHSVSHEFDLRAAGRLFVVPDVIADEVSVAALELVGHSLSHRHRGDSARLSDADLHTVLRVAGFVKELRHLGRLTATGGTGQNDNVFVVDRLHDRSFLAEDWQL